MMKVKADKFWHFIAFLFFTFILLIAHVWSWLACILVVGLAIGKELWDWWHGSYFDTHDLMADAIGVFLAWAVYGMCVRSVL